MLTHFSENKGKNIQYILYAHFPKILEREKSFNKNDVENIFLGTQNQKYIADYISKIKPPNDKEIEDLISKGKKSANDFKRIKEFYQENKNLTLSIDIDEFLKT